MKRMKLLTFLSLVLVFVAGVAYSGDVQNGKTIFNDSSLGTNGKSCNSCHPDGKSIDAGKKAFKILGTEQKSIEDAVNFCIEKALSGKALEKDSEKIDDIVSYLKSVKGKKKRERVTPGY